MDVTWALGDVPGGNEYWSAYAVMNPTPPPPDPVIVNFIHVSAPTNGVGHHVFEVQSIQNATGPFTYEWVSPQGTTSNGGATFTANSPNDVYVVLNIRDADGQQIYTKVQGYSPCPNAQPQTPC